MIDDWSREFYDEELRLTAAGYRHFAAKAKQSADRWLGLAGLSGILGFELVRELTLGAVRFPNHTYVMLAIAGVGLPLSIWKAIARLREKACYDEGRIPEHYPIALTQAAKWSDPARPDHGDDQRYGPSGPTYQALLGRFAQKYGSVLGYVGVAAFFAMLVFLLFLVITVIALIDNPSSSGGWRALIELIIILAALGSVGYLAIFLMPQYAATDAKPELTGGITIGDATVTPDQVREHIQIEPKTYTIPDAVRDRHIYIAGKSRYGKSTLILNMALQDIRQGKGVCLLDPKGDLAPQLLGHIPEHRVKDCVYLDVAAPVPLDFMSWETEQDRQTLASDIFQTFAQCSTNMQGDRWTGILKNTIKTLLAAKNCSFLDIHYFHTRPERRKRIIDSMRANNERRIYEELLHYWDVEYERDIPKHSELPITVRTNDFIHTPPLKTLLGYPNAKLNIFDLMERRKILIVKLAGVGKENGNLIGMLLVSKIQQAAFSRINQKIHERVPFYLYADEFQDFQTSAFDAILSQAGGFKLCLTLAHQYLDQLDNKKLKASIHGNVSSFILLRLQPTDAAQFKGDMEGFGHADLIPALEVGQAVYKPAQGPPALIKLAPAPGLGVSSAERITKSTIDTYSCPPPDEPLDSGQDEQRKPSPGPGGRPKTMPKYQRPT